MISNEQYATKTSINKKFLDRNQTVKLVRARDGAKYSPGTQQ